MRRNLACARRGVPTGPILLLRMSQCPDTWASEVDHLCRKRKASDRPTSSNVAHGAEGQPCVILRMRLSMGVSLRPACELSDARWSSRTLCYQVYIPAAYGGRIYQRTNDTGIVAQPRGYALVPALSPRPRRSPITRGAIRSAPMPTSAQGMRVLESSATFHSPSSSR